MAVSQDAKPSLLVVGVHRASEAYPNVLYRLRALRNSDRFAVHEINVPLWRDDAGAASSLRVPRLAARVLGAHLSLLGRLFRSEIPAAIYIPYPGVFVLNLLPRRFRQARIVVDAFISIYDTVVNDRRILGPGHVLARLLHWLEKRAYKRADLVLADTEENARHLRNVFGLDSGRVVAIPLSTNESDFAHSEYGPRGSRTIVLFVGTFVPLHGVPTIVEAAHRLRHRHDIAFRIVGDGQDATAVERLMEKSPSEITWIREWRSASELAAEIRQADVCLGIFGNTAKVQRVCPLKIYAYAAVGRAVITSETEWLQNAAAEWGEDPFATVPPADPAALARKIEELADALEIRTRLARASREFYEHALSNDRANLQFVACFEPRPEASSGN